MDKPPSKLYVWFDEEGQSFAEADLETLWGIAGDYDDYPKVHVYELKESGVLTAETKYTVVKSKRGRKKNGE